MNESKAKLILSKLSVGDVIFTMSTSPTSKILSIVQGDMPYSHVCVYVGDGLIATTGGYRFYYFGLTDALKYIKKQSKIAVGRYFTYDGSRKPISLTEDQTEKLVNTLRQYATKKIPYGTAKILQGAKSNYLYGAFSNWSDKENKTLFCSESVTKAYLTADINLMIGSGKPNAESMTPENLYRSRNNLNIIYDGMLNA